MEHQVPCPSPITAQSQAREGQEPFTEHWSQTGVTQGGLI